MKKIAIALVLIILVTSLSFSSVFASGQLSGKVICVDPGHGGDDPGAVGTLNIWGEGTVTVYEKDFNLSLAQGLKELLEDEGATVIMTRTDDSTVSINERWQLATDENVDAFVSIHYDWVEASPGIISLYGQTRPEDRTYAETIHDSVIYYSNANDKGVMDCSNSGVGFVGVLNYGGDYPRVLVEAGTMDGSSVYGYELQEDQAEIALGITNGLIDYFN